MKLHHAPQSTPHNLVSPGAQPTNKLLIVLATDVQKLMANEKKSQSPLLNLKQHGMNHRLRLGKAVTKDIRSPVKQL